MPRLQIYNTRSSWIHGGLCHHRSTFLFPAADNIYFLLPFACLHSTQNVKLVAKTVEAKPKHLNSNSKHSPKHLGPSISSSLSQHQKKSRNPVHLQLALEEEKRYFQPARKLRKKENSCSFFSRKKIVVKVQKKNLGHLCSTDKFKIQIHPHIEKQNKILKNDIVFRLVFILFICRSKT